MFPLSISSNIKRSGVMLLGSLLALTLAVPSLLISKSFSAWTAQQGMSIDVRLEVEPPAYIYEWGYSLLGAGTLTTPTQVEIPESANPSALSVSANFLLFLTTSGDVFSAGNNEQGQLGDGTKNSSTTPIMVDFPAGVNITKTAVGSYHGYAIADDGTVYAWGENSFGQLGNGTTTEQLTPVRVDFPTGVNIVEIAAGDYTTFAIADDGAVYAWGDNSWKQYGNSTTVSSLTPLLITYPNDLQFTQIVPAGSRTLGLSTTGDIYEWGDGRFNSPTLVEATEGRTYTAVSASSWSALAIADDGTVYAWGNNFYGQLGDGTTTNKPFTAVPISVNNETVVKVSSSASFSLALTESGNAYAWGNNQWGQLGDGTTISHHTPEPVLLPVSMTGYEIVAGTSSTSYLIARDAPSSVRPASQQEQVEEEQVFVPQMEADVSELSSDESVVSGEPSLSVSDAELSSSSVLDEGEPDEFSPSLSTTPHSIQSEDEQSGEEPTLLQSALFSESPLTVFFSTVVSFLTPETNFSLSPLHSRYVKGHASQWSV